MVVYAGTLKIKMHTRFRFLKSFYLQLIVAGSLLLFGQCQHTVTLDINDLEGLHNAYKNSIELPDTSFDTLLVHTYKWDDMEHTTRVEQSHLFLPDIMAYAHGFNLKYPAIRMKRANNLDSFPASTNPRVIEIKLWGEIHSRDSVGIDETFAFRGEYSTIHKVCIRKDEKWTVRVK